MMAEFGIDDLDPLADYIIDTSRRGTLQAIAEVPQGVYRHSIQVDGYDTPITLAATLTVADNHILLDYDGTSPCSPKGINVPLNYATAYSVFALRCIIGADIPNNAGSLEPFQVTGPKGCILNAQPPVPVAMRHSLGQMTPDLVYGCLTQALPDKVPAEGASCLYDVPIRHTPETVRDGGQPFALELVFNGGTGARPDKDGLSATAFPSGVWGSQVEPTEAVAPILVTRRELRVDSGGVGQHQGGHGQHIEIAAAGDEDFLVFLSVERVRFAAEGRHGGGSGLRGRIRVGHDGPDLPSKGTVRVPADKPLILETPGGGGFGSPSLRDPALVRRDLQEGTISAQTASTHYPQTTGGEKS